MKDAKNPPERLFLYCYSSILNKYINILELIYLLGGISLMKKSLFLIPLMAFLLCGCNEGAGEGGGGTGTAHRYDFSTLTLKGTAFDTGSAYSAFLSSAVNGASIVTGVTEATNVYDGAAEGGAYGNTAGLVKFGKSKANGKLVLTLASNAKKVTINCFDFYTKSEAYPTNSNYLSVNGDSKLLPYAETAGKGDLVYNLASPSSTLTIETSNTDSAKGGRCFVFSITIE